MCDIAEAKHVKFLRSVKVSGTEKNKGRISADNFMKMQRDVIAADTVQVLKYTRCDAYINEMALNPSVNHKLCN